MNIINWLLGLFGRGWDRYVDIRCARSNYEQAKQIAANSGYAGDDSHFLVRDAIAVGHAVSAGDGYIEALDARYFANCRLGGSRQKWHPADEDTDPEFADVGWSDN